MIIWRVLDRLSVTALAISGATLLISLLGFRRPAARLSRDLPFVSVLVPARNEERNIEECIRSLLAQQYPSWELLVLDDHSEDATRAILDRIASEHDDSPLRLLQGRALPADWGGKNWACHQLAQEAEPRSRYLLFTDADTVHAPGSLQRVVAVAERERLALLSLMPQQSVKTWAEVAVVPLLPLQILGYLPLPVAERLPFAAFGAANGQYMLFRHDLYDSFGGHSAQPLGLAEDVLLAQEVKAHGGRVRLANGASVVSCRMYRSPREVFAGFRRSFAGGFRLNGAISTGMLLFNLLAYAMPFLRVPFSRLARVLAVLVLVLRTLLAWRTMTPFASVLGHPVGIVLLLGAQVLAAFDALNGRDTRWKGRRYIHMAATERK